MQVTLSILRDPAAATSVELEDTDLAKSLDDLALDRSRSVAVVGGAVAAVDGAAVDLLEGSDSDVLAEVDEAGDRGGTDVEPVLVVRSELLAGSGLDDVDPGGHLELTWRGEERRGRVSGRRSECMRVRLKVLLSRGARRKGLVQAQCC